MLMRTYFDKTRKLRSLSHGCYLPKSNASWRGYDGSLTDGMQLLLLERGFHCKQSVSRIVPLYGGVGLNSSCLDKLHPALPSRKQEATMHLA